MQRLDWRHATVWLPSQTPGLQEATGLSRRDFEEAAWGVTPDGSLLKGAAAILAAFDALLPAGVPLTRTVFGLPCINGTEKTS